MIHNTESLQDIDKVISSMSVCRVTQLTIRMLIDDQSAPARMAEDRPTSPLRSPRSSEVDGRVD
jgi:hypothetical protein